MIEMVCAEVEVVAEGIRGRREDNMFVDEGNSILLRRDRDWWGTLAAAAWGSSFVGRETGVGDDSNRIVAANEIGDNCIRESLVRRFAKRDGREIVMRQIDL